MYCSVTDLRTYLGLTSSEDDALLNSFILAAQRIIQAPPPIGSGRVFEASADSTRRFDAMKDVDKRVLFFDKDLCQITSITNGDGTTVSASEYVTQPVNETPYYAVKLKSSSSVEWLITDDGDPESAIVVVGRWAYSIMPPDDIVHACKRLAAYLYRQKDNASDLDRALVVGNSTVLPSSSIS